MRKFSVPLIFLGTVLLLSMIIAIPPTPVEAQCKTPSSCKTCHEVQGQFPVSNQGLWHKDHIIIDACAECHGGTRLAQNKDSAHQGMVTDLNTMATYCAACHCDDLDERFAPYAEEQGITDIDFLSEVQQKASAAGAFPAAGFTAPSLIGPGAQPSQNSTEAIEDQTEESSTNKFNTPANWISAGLFIVIVLGGTRYVIANERRLKSVSPEKTTMIRWLWLRFKQENWSPYVAGIGLGVIGILAVVLANHLMTASGGIAVIASSLINRVAPSSIEKNIYFRFVMPPALDWEVLVIIGILVGGFLASISSGTFKLRWNDDPAWKKVFGTSKWKRFLIGFLGAVIIQYGASIAGGCTSGLAISGGMLLAPSAFLFMAGMFISGILVALLIYRRRY